MQFWCVCFLSEFVVALNQKWLIQAIGQIADVFQEDNGCVLEEDKKFYSTIISHMWYKCIDIFLNIV